MKERPILFSGPMVRAIREGRKTQTRRVVKPQPSPCGLRKLRDADIQATGLDPSLWYGADPFTEAIKCPYGQPGDRLWVRETWRLLDSSKECACYDDCQCSQYHGKPIYRANSDSDDKWQPSIFMPRWASRITLEIVSVRVERINEITEQDAISDGIECRGGKWGVDGVGVGLGWMSPHGAFRELWDSINSSRGYGWDSNPWVWVITFKRV